jgi:hypothetical protein
MSCYDLNKKVFPKSEPFVPDIVYFSLIFNLIIRDEQNRQAECNKPNAIPRMSNLAPPYGCTDNIVSSGLIYNSITNEKITTNTLTTGINLNCLMENGKLPLYGSWQRGTEITDIIPPNPPSQLLFGFSTSNDNYRQNSNLNYNVHFSKSENLFCYIEDSSTEIKGSRYQLLKVRIP